MQENSYIQVLIQSLHQKVEALDSIIEKNKEQYEILSAEEADMDAFEKNIDEKSQYIDKIVFLDDGFEEIYTRVKEELDGNRAAYTEDERSDLHDHGTQHEDPGSGAAQQRACRNAVLKGTEKDTSGQSRQQSCHTVL